MDGKQYSRRGCLHAAAAGGLGALAVAGTRPAQAALNRLPEVKIAGYAYDRVRAIQDGRLSLDGFEGSGADFLEPYKQYINDGKTIITSPHKLYGPEHNDLALQLRKNGIDQVILAGMSANLCTESHLRELLEQGFEVAVVKDGTAAAMLPEGDGYLAALTNFRYIANALWTTDEVVSMLS